MAKRRIDPHRDTIEAARIQQELEARDYETLTDADKWWIDNRHTLFPQHNAEPGPVNGVGFCSLCGRHSDALWELHDRKRQGKALGLFCPDCRAKLEAIREEAASDG